MCTLTWFCDASGYRVFFNRDEQKIRAKALPPQIVSRASGRCVMPIDPQGGGSWISSNQYGMTIALLNFYQGKLPTGQLISRGTIVQGVSLCRSFKEVLGTIKNLTLSNFAPFTLTVFCPEVLANYARVGVIRWDGEELQDYTSAGPLISSGVNFEQVSKARLNTYREMIGKSKPSEKLENYLNYHSSHTPNRSSLAVCMHREDAHTVSFSHIEVNRHESVFRYADGSPCEHECEYQVRLKLEGLEDAAQPQFWESSRPRQ